MRQSLRVALDWVLLHPLALLVELGIGHSVVAFSCIFLEIWLIPGVLLVLLSLVRCVLAEEPVVVHMVGRLRMASHLVDRMHPIVWLKTKLTELTMNAVLLLELVHVVLGCGTSTRCCVQKV